MTLLAAWALASFQSAAAVPGDVALAVSEARALLSQGQPFTGIVELDVERHRGVAPVGLTRRVILAGAGAPRIRSQ